MSLPLAKLLSLTVKTISKPIAKRIKSRAVDHDGFKRMCINVAEFNNKTTHHFNRIVRKYNVPYRSINEEYAVNKGAEMLGELVVYSIAGGLIIEEYTRTKISKAKNEQEVQDRLRILESEIKEIKEKLS